MAAVFAMIFTASGQMRRADCMKCGACKISVRAGCSYDVTNLRCPITMTVNGFYDECDVTARQKLIRLLEEKSLVTPADVAHVADYLLSNGISVQ